MDLECNVSRAQIALKFVFVLISQQELKYNVIGALGATAYVTMILSFYYEELNLSLKKLAILELTLVF